MAYESILSLQPAACTTLGELLYGAKEFLKDAGYACDGSGDGGALFSDDGSDVIDSGASGAAGFDNVGAWWAGHFGDRYICIWIETKTVGLATTDSKLTIQYKHGSGFDYASADANTPPTGGNYVLGTGAGTGQQFVEWSTPTMYLFGSCDQAGIGAFWLSAVSNNSTTAVGMGLMMEEVYAHPDDTDPVVWYCSGGANAASPSGFSSQMVTDDSNWYEAYCRATFFEGVSEVWHSSQALSLEGSTNEILLDHSGYAESPLDGKLQVERHAYGTRQSALRAFKGWGKSAVWYAPNDSTGVGRRQLWTHASANDYIRMTNSLLPWDGSVPTLPGAYANAGSIVLVESYFEGGSSPPTISDPDPVPGDFSTSREDDRRTVVQFTHTRKRDGTLPTVWVKVASQVFMVYDGTGFYDLFSGGSTVDQTGDVFVFDVIPAGGWWGRAEFFSADSVLSVLEGSE